MSLFVSKDGTHKSPVVMMGFFMALLFGVIFWALYLFLARPLYEHMMIGGNEALSTSLHCLIIALVGTAVCCLLFLLPDKRLVPAGFACLGVFMLAFYIACFMLDAEARSTILYFITLHFLAPVLVGNTVSWAIYLRLRRKKRTYLQR